MRIISDRTTLQPLTSPLMTKSKSQRRFYPSREFADEGSSPDQLLSGEKKETYGFQLKGTYVLCGLCYGMSKNSFYMRNALGIEAWSLVSFNSFGSWILYIPSCVKKKNSFKSSPRYSSCPVLKKKVNKSRITYQILRYGWFFYVATTTYYCYYTFTTTCVSDEERDKLLDTIKNNAEYEWPQDIVTTEYKCQDCGVIALRHFMPPCKHPYCNSCYQKYEKQCCKTCKEVIKEFVSRFLIIYDNNLGSGRNTTDRGHT